MARISIEPIRAKETLTGQSELEKTLKGLYREVENVRTGLTYRIAGQEAIAARLRTAAEQINKEAISTGAMRSGLMEVIARYEQTESGNLDRLGAEKTSVQQAGNAEAGSMTSPSWFQDFKWDNFMVKELANLVGPFGFVFSGGQKLAEGKWANAVNEVVKSLGKGAKVLIDKPKAEWFDNLFGLNTKYADGTGPTFWEGLGDFSSKGKAVGTVAKWATALADSFIKNKEEFGADNWGGRFWAETAVETGISLGEGAAVAVGVGAVAAALGGAPAIAIGAATVGATMLIDWGLDNIVSWATGGSQTSWKEAASDFICDTGEKIVEAVGPVITKTVDTVKGVVKTGVDFVADAGKKAMNAVGDGFNKVKDGFFNLFSGCSWGKPCCVGGGW